MNRRALQMMGCGLGMLILILDSRQAAVSAQAAMELCIRTVIPSLFPFFLLSAYLAGAGGGNILFSCFLGGYPVGAQALARSMDTGLRNQHQANRMLAWCSQAGPSFIFGIAAAKFPGIHYSWLLWVIQVISALSVGLVFSGLSAEKTAAWESYTGSRSSAMVTALRAMGQVCGWVVIFRVILGFLERWLFFFLSDIVKILLSGLLELTNGCLMLDRIEDLQLRFLLCLVFLNFGGFCVVLQTASVANQLDIRYYLTGKLLQTSFALLYGCVFLGHLGAALALLLFFGIILWVKFRKNSSFPAKIGV